MEQPIHARRDFAVYAILVLCLLAVHFIIDATHATRSVSQAAVFSWTGLGIIGALGLAGVFLTHLSRLPGLWDPEISIGAKLWLPIASGALTGAVALGLDLATGHSQEIASRLHVDSIHIVFPLSVPIYFGGAILVTIIYFFVLIPLGVWLVSRLLLKGGHINLVYWLIAIPCALIEPWTQHEIADAMEGDIGDVINLFPSLGLEFGQIWYLRRAGLIAAILFRVGYYAFSHVVAGLTGI